MYRLVFAGEDGLLYDHRSMRATGRAGDRIIEIAAGDLIRLPEGASLALVPGGAPVGVGRGGRFSVLERNPRGEGPVYAVGALLPQGYTRTLLPAYRRSRDEKPLPLLGYAAVACRGGELYVAARRTEDPGPWDPKHYNTGELPRLVRERLSRSPENPILRQLARCSLDYQCFTAQNIFYARWEGGVPVSPACNARCLGCISLQPAECCPSPQSRIKYRPTPDEVAEVAVNHLKSGESAIVSFGQGCEGEPALAAGVIAESIKKTRSATGLGTINMNTNGGHVEGVEAIIGAGLDSIRVSLISAREETYDAYYRPRGYTPAGVRRSIRAAVSHGVYTSLNLLVFPGLTDRAEEVEALVELVEDTGVNMVQMRNLNIDPDLLFSRLPAAGGELLGVTGLIGALEAVPGLAVGSFSKPVKRNGQD